MKNTLIFIIAIIIAGGSGFILQRYLNEQVGNNNPAIGQQRTEFAAMDLEGRLRNIKEWDGKLIFLNFWATWCPPCKKEIPAFVELQQAYGDQGLQIIGLAIDDVDSVTEFARATGMNYPSLLVQSDGVTLSKRFGNGAGVLPYTVIINRKGEVSDTIMGELSKKRAKKILKKYGIHL
ncbi:MAG TPA: TlpA family protein disulfide reductase [Gammaproteobacteria bacterium]|nr:TlpA family protein disulfide reductase [Gammaproteobacteria bacterium]